MNTEADLIAALNRIAAALERLAQEVYLQSNAPDDAEEASGHQSLSDR